MTKADILSRANQIFKKATSYSIRLHEIFTYNKEVSASWIKVIFTLFVVLYIPIMALISTSLLKEFDDKNQGEASKVSEASYISTMLSAQQYIIKTLPLLEVQRESNQQIEKQQDILRLVESKRNLANRNISYNMNYISLKYNAFGVVIQIAFATGLLQLGMVMADASSKIKRNYMLYLGLSSGVIGIVTAVYSGFHITTLFDLMINL